MPEQRAIPQMLADEMSLAASACWCACRAGRPFLGVPEITATLWDAEACAIIARYQDGYMKEVDRRKRSTILGGGPNAKMWRSQPILFTSMPLNYQRALASRFLAWRAEILAENPNLDWNDEKGYHWSADAGADYLRPIDQTDRPVYWRDQDANKGVANALGIVWPRTPLL